MIASMWESLYQLANDQQIYFGTSSWKYEGWQGLVYNDTYKSKKAFNDHCLSEYARHFPAVGIDHTYYSWPNPTTFQKYQEQTPPEFKMGLKATEFSTVFKFPNIKRYGKNAGKVNEGFLEPNLFKEKFLAPLERYQQKVGVIMLEFSKFRPGTVGTGREFLQRLDHFLSQICPSPLPLAVEMRNEAWLQKPYFELLQKYGVSHVSNSWTEMPPIGDQLELQKAYTAPSLVSRILLKPGRKYDQAVKSFSPYREIQEPLADVRNDAVKLIRQALSLKIPAYVFVNNRAEGCAPRTIEAIVNLMKT